MAQINRLITLLLHVGPVQLFNPTVQMDINSHSLDHIDFVIENILGQAVIGNTYCCHAAAFGSASKTVT